MNNLQLEPITLKQANAFIDQHHSHHIHVTGWKFGVGVKKGNQLVGVGIAGRPVSRMLQDGFTLEITRCCTTREKNVASMIYGALTRAAFALGYTKVITYTLLEESGSSLNASNFTRVREAGGGSWSRDNRPRNDKHPLGKKVLWERIKGE